MSRFKIDTKRKTLWDLSKGVIYNIGLENDYYIILTNKNGFGLFDKKEDCVIIEPFYDWIESPYKGIPIDRNYPFIISKNEKHGIALPNGTIAIEAIIDSSKYIVYPHTYGEGFVAASLNKENMRINDPMCFLDTKGEQCTDFIYTSIRQPFKNGKAITTIGKYIIELDNKFNMIDSYDSAFYGFSDEIYFL